MKPNVCFTLPPTQYHTFHLLQIIRQPGCAELIESHASLQRLRGRKLNIVAIVVELTYLNVVIKFDSLLGGHRKARDTMLECTLNLTLSGKVMLLRSVE